MRPTKEGLAVNGFDLTTFMQRPSESVLRNALNAAPIGASIGVDGKIVYANPQCARMWGYSHPGHMVGMPFFDLIAPAWHPLVITLWRLRREGCDPLTYDLEGQRPDGSMFPYRCTSISFETEIGKATLAYFTECDECADIDEQLHALESLGVSD